MIGCDSSFVGGLVTNKQRHDRSSLRKSKSLAQAIEHHLVPVRGCVDNKKSRIQMQNSNQEADNARAVPSTDHGGGTVSCWFAAGSRAEP
jgi:hypothetical protein